MSVSQVQCMTTGLEMFTHIGVLGVAIMHYITFHELAYDVVCFFNNIQAIFVAVSKDLGNWRSILRWTEYQRQEVASTHADTLRMRVVWQGHARRNVCILLI